MNSINNSESEINTSFSCKNKLDTMSISTNNTTVEVDLISFLENKQDLKFENKITNFFSNRTISISEKSEDEKSLKDDKKKRKEDFKTKLQNKLKKNRSLLRELDQKNLPENNYTNLLHNFLNSDNQFLLEKFNKLNIFSILENNF